MSTIKRVSFSRLQDFEKCRYMAKLKYVDYIPEPERPLPAGKTEHAFERGIRVHDSAELYVRGGVELIPELGRFENEFNELRDLYDEGKVSLEGEWAVDEQWNPVAWKSHDAWLRMKLDAFVDHGDGTGRVIDYKTGKRVFNEVKHTEQGQVYQLGAYMRFHNLQKLTVEFWYLDLGETDVKTYTRDQGTAYFDKYNTRFLAVTSATEFPPNPNVHSCRWCPYNDGICPHGVKKDTKKPKKPKFRKTAPRKGGFNYNV